MPTNLEIPSRRLRHCEPCTFHKCTAAMFGRDHFWKDYNCMHPESFGDMKLANDTATREKQIELRGRLLEHGRHIGRTENQPSWCPLLRKESDETND